MEIRVIQQECPRCNLSRAYDWQIGKTRDENLRIQGWRWDNKTWRWVCPDCWKERGNANG